MSKRIQTEVNDENACPSLPRVKSARKRSVLKDINSNIPITLDSVITLQNCLNSGSKLHINNFSVNIEDITIENLKTIYQKADKLNPSNSLVEKTINVLIKDIKTHVREISDEVEEETVLDIIEDLLKILKPILITHFMNFVEELNKLFLESSIYAQIMGIVITIIGVSTFISIIKEFDIYKYKKALNYVDKVDLSDILKLLTMTSIVNKNEAMKVMGSMMVYGTDKYCKLNEFIELTIGSIHENTLYVLIIISFALKYHENVQSIESKNMLTNIKNKYLNKLIEAFVKYVDPFPDDRELCTLIRLYDAKVNELENDIINSSSDFDKLDHALSLFPYYLEQWNYNSLLIDKLITLLVDYRYEAKIYVVLIGIVDKSVECKLRHFENIYKTSKLTKDANIKTKHLRGCLLFKLYLYFRPNQIEREPISKSFAFKGFREIFECLGEDDCQFSNYALGSIMDISYDEDDGEELLFEAMALNLRSRKNNTVLGVLRSIDAAYSAYLGDQIWYKVPFFNEFQDGIMKIAYVNYRYVPTIIEICNRLLYSEEPEEFSVKILEEYAKRHMNSNNKEITNRIYEAIETCEEYGIDLEENMARFYRTHPKPDVRVLNV